VLIVATGVPRLITGDMVAPGAIVIDIGINAVPAANGRTRLVGDVDFETVKEVAGAISPVPGGVGPITDVWVLRNAMAAALERTTGEDAVESSVTEAGAAADRHRSATFRPTAAA